MGCIHCGGNPGFEGTAHLAGPMTLAVVPTLSERALIALAIVLACGGVIAVRSRTLWRTTD